MAVTIDGTNGITSPDFEPSSSTTPTNGLFLPTTNALGFATNSTERLRLDASGNLGLGVTPSAWDSGYSIFQAGSNGSAFGGRSAANTAYMMSNSVRSGSAWKYINTAAAAQFQIENGIFYWFNAPSGTAGNAITFTQAMTLDASGNLAINATSVTAIGANIPTLKISGKNTTNGGGIQLYSSDDTTVKARTWAETGGWFFDLQTAHPIVFQTSGSERARIDSSGNLLVGTTSVFGKLASQQTTSAVNFRAECNVTSYTSTNIWSTFTSSGNNNTTAIHFAAYTGTNVCVIYGNGNIQNTNNSYGALSDIKLKENIVDATPKLEDLCKVKIRNFSLKGEQNHKQIGVVAQELEEIFPGLVEEVADRDKEGNILGTSTKSVKYSVFTPMLIKAIQELTARLEALENK